MAKPVIGGQAVLEGVMMRAPERMAVAVRKPDGAIALHTEEITPPAQRNKVLGWPIVRGCVNFVQMLTIGMHTITVSAELSGELAAEEPSKFERWLSRVTGRKTEDIAMAIAVVMAMVLAVGLFFVVPSLFATFIRGLVTSQLLINLLEGAFRILLMLGYMLLVSLLKEIKRTFRYHGAEHKVVHCYEHDLPLTVDNAAKFSTLHPRCGTSFLLIVMVISILVFTLFGWNLNAITRILSRLALLPLVAGISYEALRFLGKHDGVVVRALRWPGLQLQRVTTKEPDAGMIEVAIAAFNAALGEKSAQEGVPGQPEPSAEAAAPTDAG